MKFEEPKVEILRIDNSEIVFASYAGGATTCTDSGGPYDCADGNSMLQGGN